MKFANEFINIIYISINLFNRFDIYRQCSSVEQNFCIEIQTVFVFKNSIIYCRNNIITVGWRIGRGRKHQIKGEIKAETFGRAAAGKMALQRLSYVRIMNYNYCRF